MLKDLVKIFLLFSVFLFSFWGCENEYPDSIYNPDETFKPNPTINTISPDLAFAGVDTIDIMGTNFSTNPSEIKVFFNGEKGEIVSSTANLVRVIPANIIGDSIKIQLRVTGALEYAEYKSYKLEPITIEYGVFDHFDDAYGLAVDLNENVYVSLFGNKLIQKITPDLERNDFAIILRDKTSQMKMGPDGSIYYLFGLKFMLRILPDGSKDELFAILPGSAYDLDFDENLNIYSGGSGNAIYKTTLNKDITTVKQYPDVFVHAVRVYDGYLYVAGSYSGADDSHVVEGVWRNQIVEGADSLGDTELVFDFGSVFVGKQILSMIISDDGNIYLGTNGDEGIYVIKNDGSFGALYPGVLGPNIYAMTWGNSDFIYVTRKSDVDDNNRILRINMRKKTAPYYGRK
ncbi:MAG: IPT/TIG domain-containing protein [Melioribacteraceae bacterium]